MLLLCLFSPRLCFFCRGLRCREFVSGLEAPDSLQGWGLLA